MYVITANSLAHGTVVFFTEDGGWSGEIAAARIYGDQQAADTDVAVAERDVAARVILDPYKVEVAPHEGRPVPVRLRERIRASGPSIAYAVPAANLVVDLPEPQRDAA